MVMPVTPGGAYFGLYSDFGDVYRGEAVSYAVAAASAATADARDVADLSVPYDVGAGTPFDTHPKLDTFSGSGSFLEICTTYDNGYWGDGDPPWGTSYFLVELQGPNASEFAVGDDTFGIHHYVSSDGGQAIYLESSVDGLLTGLTRIRVWRVGSFPGDPLPEPHPTSGPDSSARGRLCNGIR